jgi:hypothetical protein
MAPERRISPRIGPGASALVACALAAALGGCTTAYDRVEVAGVLVRIDGAVPPAGVVLQTVPIPPGSCVGARADGTILVAIDQRQALLDTGAAVPAAVPPTPPPRDPASSLLTELQACAAALSRARAAAGADHVDAQAMRALAPLCQRLAALARALAATAPLGAEAGDGAARLRARQAAAARGEPRASAQPPPLLVYQRARRWEPSPAAPLTPPLALPLAPPGAAP